MQESKTDVEVKEHFLQRSYNKVPNWIKNKYFIATIGFGAFLVFFDSNNVFLQYERWSRLRELNVNEKHLVSEIEKTSNERNMLKNSAETIEKYARENYLMKKDNEDLFVIQSNK